METARHINTSFLLTIIFHLEKKDFEFKNVLISQIQNLTDIFKRVENNDFEAVFNDYVNSFMKIIETIIVNDFNIFDLIDFDNKPVFKGFSLKNRKLKKLYNQITDYFFNVFEQFQNKNISELTQKYPDELDNYFQNALKFFFFFIVADLFLNNQIKLNKKKQKILFDELKQNFEIYFAVLKLLNLYKIDEKTSNQLDRNIIIKSRTIALKHNLTRTIKVNTVSEILKPI